MDSCGHALGVDDDPGLYSRRGPIQRFEGETVVLALHEFLVVEANVDGRLFVLAPLEFSLTTRCNAPALGLLGGEEVLLAAHLRPLAKKALIHLSMLAWSLCC